MRSGLFAPRTTTTELSHTIAFYSGFKWYGVSSVVESGKLIVLADDAECPHTGIQRLRTMPNPSRPKILPAQLREVRAFYAIGKASLKDSPGRLRYGEANSSAGEIGLQPEMLRKARQIAELFPEEEMMSLLSRCKASGFAIGITHLMRLASVRKGREHLIDRMIRHHWSLRQLNNEIAKLQPTTEGRGRRRLVPNDARGQIVVLKKECVRWQRLNQALTPTLKSPRVRHALKNALKSIDSLMSALSQG